MKYEELFDISIWYGHLGPSEVQQCDEALIHTIYPKLPLGNSSIPPEGLPISHPCCKGEDYGPR